MTISEKDTDAGTFIVCCSEYPKAAIRYYKNHYNQIKGGLGNGLVSAVKAGNVGIAKMLLKDTNIDPLFHRECLSETENYEMFRIVWNSYKTHSRGYFYNSNNLLDFYQDLYESSDEPIKSLIYNLVGDSRELGAYFYIIIGKRLRYRRYLEHCKYIRAAKKRRKRKSH